MKRRPIPSYPRCMDMRSFLVIRHGQTDWNLHGRMQGQIKDVPLNATGLAQAQDAAALLEAQNFDLIVASPLDRAYETAQIIAARKKVDIICDDRLIERSWGKAEGLRRAELDHQDPATFFTPDGRMDWWIKDARQPAGSESLNELADRATSAVTEHLTRQAPRRLLFVTHGAWLRALFYRLAGLDRIFANARPYRAQETPAGWTMEDVTHPPKP